MSIAKNIVFVCLSDTHGNHDNLEKLYTGIQETIAMDKQKNPEVKHVLFVPGDVHSMNGVLSAPSSGEYDIEVFAEIAKLFQYKFFTPGNHDYLHGESQLIGLIERAGFSAVISNVSFTENSNLFYGNIASVEIDGETLKIVGLMTPETLRCSNAQKYIKNVEDFIAPNFKNIKPDIILSHLGSPSDKLLPCNSIVVGGHTHDAQIFWHKHDDGKVNLVINSGAGEGFAVIRDSGRVAEFIKIQDCEPSPVIQEITKKYENKFGINLSQIVFKIHDKSVMPSGLDLPEDQIASTESHLRIVDSMMTRVTADAISEFFELKSNEFVLYPAAAIRTNFIPGQLVTGKALSETYYYNNQLVQIVLNGRELIAVLALGVMSGYKNFDNRGQLLIPSSGLKYGYDINQKSPGDTIRWVKIEEETEEKFISLDEKFIIVTTDWIANTIKKLYPEKVMDFYSSNLKIHAIVGEYLKDKILAESFAERVTCSQSLQEQAILADQPENHRAVAPSFDRFVVCKKDINYLLHQNNYEQDVCLSNLNNGKNLPGIAHSRIMSYAGILFPYPKECNDLNSEDARNLPRRMCV